MTETLQEMAARLGVKLCESVLGDREQYFAKDGWQRVYIGQRDGRSVIRVSQQSLSEPEDIRDLSDCLQVAARYLEEVHG